MKRMMLILVLTLTSVLYLFAPSNGVIYIMMEEPIIRTLEPKDWAEAIAWVETGNEGKGAYNRDEPLAVGKFQQYPIFVEDVNRILGYQKYTLEDRMDDKKAEEMFWIYQNHYNPEMSFEKMCRIQCGGPDGYKQACTLPYYNLVKARLYS
jgi:hypothetical protein